MTVPRFPLSPIFREALGALYLSKCEDLLNNPAFSGFEGKVQLLFTSPPFPLNRKKAYGNLTGQQYLAWIASLAPLFKRFLTPSGSIVMEIGNAWEEGEPIQSTLPIESLLAFKKEGAFHLCQEFTYYNPARLPSPAQWVNIDRIRVKDATTRLWWMSPITRPKASNRNILKEYGERQKKLMRRGSYNAGRRPSEFNITPDGFLKDNGGAIPPNLIEVANTKSTDPFQQFCRANGLKGHPARMPAPLAEFFIRFLTSEGDLVLDPFGGSNTTGLAAHNLKRHWISIEARQDYALASISRFNPVRSRKLLVREGFLADDN